MPHCLTTAARPLVALSLALLVVVPPGCAPTPWVRNWQLLVDRTVAAEAESRQARDARSDLHLELLRARERGASPAAIAKLQAALDQAASRAKTAEAQVERAYDEMGLTLGPLVDEWRAYGLQGAGERRRDWHGEAREELLRQGRHLVERAAGQDLAATAPGSRPWRRAVRWAEKIWVLAYAETSHAHEEASCGNARAFAAQMTALRLRELLHEGNVAPTVLGAPVLAAAKRCFDDIGQFPELDSGAAWTFWLDDAQQRELVARGAAYLQGRIDAAGEAQELSADMPASAWWRLVHTMARLHRDLGGGADYGEAVALPRAASSAEPEPATDVQTDDREGDEVRAWIWAGPAMQFGLLRGHYMPAGYQERMAVLYDAQERVARLLARAFAPQPGPRGPLAPIALLDPSVRRDLSPHLIRAIAAAPAWNPGAARPDRRHVSGREPFDAIADRAVARLMEKAVRRYAAAASGPYQRALWHAVLVNAAVATAGERTALEAHRVAVDQLERAVARREDAKRRWRRQPMLEGQPPFPTEAAFALATHGEVPPELPRALASLRLQRSILSLVRAPNRGSAGLGGARLLRPRDPACELAAAMRVTEADVWSIEPPWRGLDR